MNKPYFIHFSGMVGRDVWNSITLKGSLLSTELCVSRGILFTIWNFNNSFFKDFNHSSGTRHYQPMYAHPKFWQSHKFIPKEDYLYGSTFLPEYRKFIINNIHSYL